MTHPPRDTPRSAPPPPARQWWVLLVSQPLAGLLRLGTGLDHRPPATVRLDPSSASTRYVARICAGQGRVSDPQSVGYCGLTTVERGRRVTARQVASCALCSARLARDNAARVCAPCQRRTRAAAADPAFWVAEPISSAAASRDMGAVVLAFPAASSAWRVARAAASGSGLAGHL